MPPKPKDKAMKKAITGVAIASILALAGCGAGEQIEASESTPTQTAEATPTPTPEPAVEFKDEYDSVDDLVADFEAAGGDCSGWSQENNVTLALESGTCDDDTVISTYISPSEITELMETQKALFEDLEMSGESSWLVGDKWIINTSEDELAVISQFGGKEVRF